MANHSSVLAWKPPWIDEPGGLPSVGQKILYVISDTLGKLLDLARDRNMSSETRRKRNN